MARKINKFKSLIVPGLLSVGGLLGVVGPVHANTQGPITTTTPIPSQLTDWSGNLSFPQFNPALGTLTSVEIVLSGNMTTTLTVTNNGASSSTGQVQTELQVGVNDVASILAPGGLPIAPLVGIPHPEIDQTSPYQDIGTIAAGGNVTLPAQNLAVSADNTYSNATLLSELTGLGSIVLPAETRTFTGSKMIVGGNDNIAQVTDASLSGTVTYTYTPVPEPATMSLLMIGGTTILLQRRKRVVSA